MYMHTETISKYRGQWMGIAILLVALFHCSIQRNHIAIAYLCFIGDMGVDFFFFLSGMGMYYAFQKKEVSLLEFYQKRTLRIVPAWFLVNLLRQYVFGAGIGLDLPSVIKLFTGFTFWLDGNLFYWYIPAQLCFYLMTPLFMKLYKQNKRKARGIFAGVWLVLLAICLLAHNADYFIFLFRWPIYFTGIFFGDLAYHKRKLPKYIPWMALVLLGICGSSLYWLFHHINMTTIRYEYKYIVFYPFALSLCLLGSLLMEKSHARLRSLQWLGGITLEIYLLHEFLLAQFTRLVADIPFDSWYIIWNGMVFVITLAVAWALHQGISLSGRVLKLAKRIG